MRWLWLLWLPCCHADDWGRLFFSAEQRQSPPVATAADPAAPVSHRLDGELRRGQRVLRFIDGRPDPRPVPDGLRVGEVWQEETP